MERKSSENKSRLNTVTPVSRYVAMILFVSLPFIGGWVGYTLAPVKTVVIETKEPPQPLVEKALTIENATVINEGDIEVTLSTGEKKVIAKAYKPVAQEQYYKVETYSEAIISPNRKFAALQGIGFEDSFVRVYNVEADRLEDNIYGDIQDWDNVGRLGILSCDLSGEECTSYISTSSDTPWVLEKVTR